MTGKRQNRGTLQRSAKVVFLATALFLLTGCEKRVIAAAAPPPPPTPVVSVPPPSHPTEPMPEAPVIASAPMPVPVETVKRPTPPRQRNRQPAAIASPTVTASVSAPPVTELGELTTGGESNNDSLKRQTDDLLKAQNRRLSGLAPGVIALHTQQVEQARLFLRQAGDAWIKQDIEGARTLGTKAKVLLDEVLQ